MYNAEAITGILVVRCCKGFDYKMPVKSIYVADTTHEKYYQEFKKKISTPVNIIYTYMYQVILIKVNKKIFLTYSTMCPSNASWFKMWKDNLKKKKQVNFSPSASNASC